MVNVIYFFLTRSFCIKFGLDGAKKLGFFGVVLEIGFFCSAWFGVRNCTLFAVLGLVLEIGLVLQYLVWC